jgi:5-methylcytosine-specific restriction enzyme subunit McrC
LAGLGLAAAVTGDLGLRRESSRLASLLARGVTVTRLDADLLERAARSVNRLTAVYQPALTLIRLLREARGVSLTGDDTRPDLPGYLFDMNGFFQSLLSRFLRDNLTGHTVRDEHTLRGMMRYAPGYNPRHRNPPAPRPDFVVHREGRPMAVLDAKYRDLWENPLPRDMLYQLAVYAVGHVRRAATILYPTTDSRATEARINVTEPTFDGLLAQVSLRPVVLPTLDALIASDRSAVAHRRRTAYAEWLLTGEEPESENKAQA